MYGFYPLGLLAGILLFFVVDYMDRDEKVKTSQNPDAGIPTGSEDPKQT